MPAGLKVVHTTPTLGDPGRRRPALLLALLAVLFALGVAPTVVPPVLVLAATAALLPLVLALRAPRALVLVTLVLFLPFLGVVRRITGTYVATIDPLNFVGPLVACACLAATRNRVARPPKTPLSAAVGVLGLIGLVEVLNPLQGGLVVGIVGAGLFIGPLVWFYVGRAVGDAATLSTLLRWLRVVAVVAALYGLKQLLFGFTGFEDRWIAERASSYHALGIGGSTRPFSIFSSGAEYSYFLALGAVLIFAWSPRIGRSLRLILVLGLLAASFYAGSRSIFVTGIVAVGLVSVVRHWRRLGAALLICGLLSVMAIVLLRYVPLANDSNTTAAKIRNRTLEGLSDPFNRDVSTLGIHLDIFRYGIDQGVRNPLGQGAGSVTSAGTKLGGGSGGSTEHDFPNVLVAYGWIGGLALIVVVVRVYRLVDRTVKTGESLVAAPALFCLVVFGAWFSGQLYAVSAIVWFCLGAIDRQLAAGSDPADPGEAGDGVDASPLSSGVAD